MAIADFIFLAIIKLIWIYFSKEMLYSEKQTFTDICDMNFYRGSTVLLLAL